MGFNLPSTFSSSKSPRDPYPEYQRPFDWPTITDAPDKVQFLVNNEYGDTTVISTSFVQPGSQNVFIDWGDGTIDTITTPDETFTSHTFATGGTPSSLGYDTWVVQVYYDAGATLFVPKFPRAAAPFGSDVSPVLEIYCGDDADFNTTTANPASMFFTEQPLYQVEFIKLPSTLRLNGGIVFPKLFFLLNLGKIVMPISAPTATDYSQCFQNNPNLTGSIIIPQDSLNVTTFSSSFLDTPALQSVVFPPTLNFCTTFAFCFLVSGIRSVVFPPTPICSSWNRCFENAPYVTFIKFTSIEFVGTVNFLLAFNLCRSLAVLDWPQSIASGCLLNLNSQTFAGCQSLKSLTFPLNFNIVSMTNLFSNLNGLETLIFQGPCPSLNNFSFACQNTCIQKVVMPTSTNAAVNMQNAFAGCRSLSSVTFFADFKLGSMASVFQDCRGLNSVILPSNDTTATSFQTAFQRCIALESVVFPTVMNSASNFLSAFSECKALKSLIFPAAMNSVTTMPSMLSLNWSLKTLTLPTSMSALAGGAASIFLQTYSLDEIIWPATVGGITIMNTSMQNGNAQQITLPTTQLTLVNSLVGLFSNLHALTTVNNMDKLGNNSISGTALAAATFLSGTPNLTAVNLSCRLTKLDLYPGTGTVPSKLTSVRLTNTGAGQWGGASPQIDARYLGLSTAALNILFADIAAQGAVSGKVINIEGTVGTAGLTAADKLVLTDIGWTITE